MLTSQEITALEQYGVSRWVGNCTMLGIINEASLSIDNWGNSEDWKNKDVILDIIRAAIMRHCDLNYPEYSLAPWHRVAKYLAKSDKSLSMDLELLDPDFDDMQ